MEESTALRARRTSGCHRPAGSGTPVGISRYVRTGGMAASDVLQVWVDVAAHPSRGCEQADLIRKRVLCRIIEGSQ